MTQVHFTLETEDIQSLIDQSVKDNELNKFYKLYLIS